jgi:S-methylmethionine-dependent homocysteine/selenocysteine methylase
MYRTALPQLAGDRFFTDAGVETDLIFNHGIEIPEFAACTLLATPTGRAALTRYFEGFLALAHEHDAGLVLDTVTWKAHAHWAGALGLEAAELRATNEEAVRFAAELRARYAANARPIVLNAVIGPRGDAYKPEVAIEASAAEDYFGEQLGWLAATDTDMITATTFNQASEAIGLTRAARTLGLPVVISFTLETTGVLPTGQTLAAAIDEVDDATAAYPAYYMINCAHPDHFAGVLHDAAWARRIRGIRANASRRSHTELDAAPALDRGDPEELAAQYRELALALPWLNVFGGCCGSDLSHLTSIARALPPEAPAATTMPARLAR